MPSSGSLQHQGEAHRVVGAEGDGVQHEAVLILFDL